MSSNAKKTLPYDFMDNYENQSRELFTSPRRTSAIDTEHRRIDAALGPYEKAFNYLTPRYIGIVNAPTTSTVAPTNKAHSPSKHNPMTSNKRRHESIHQHKEQPQKKTRYCGGENTDPIITEKRKNMTKQQQRPPPQHLQRGHYKQVPAPRAEYTQRERKPMLDHNRDQLRPSLKPSTTKIYMPTKEQQRPNPQQSLSGKYSQGPQQYLQPPPPIRDSQQEIKPHHNQVTPPQSLVEPTTKRLEIKIENLTGKGKLPPGLEAEIRKFAAKNNERGCNFHKDFGRMRFWVRLYENRQVVVTLENKEMKVTCVPDEAVFIRKNHR